jgi:integrase
MPERISVWPYQNSKQRLWALEVRFPLLGKKIQRRGFASRSEAIKAAKQLRLEGKPQPVVPQDNHSLASVCSEYLDSLKGAIREHTRANYADILGRYLLPTFGHKPICEVSEPEISRLLSRLRANGLRAGTVNTVRARAIGLFNYAAKRQILHSNPAALTRVQQKYSDSDTAVQEPLSANEAINLLLAARGTSLELFLALCLGLGLRKGEVLGLKWSDIDLEAGQVTIQRSRGQIRYLSTDGKLSSSEIDGPVKTSGSNRKLPLNSTVLAALMQSVGDYFPQPGHYVVSSGNGQPMSLSVLTRKYKSLIEGNNLRYVRIHDLRHSAAVLALENHAPIEAVSQALGHSGIEITKRVYAPKVRALDEVFAQAIDNSLSNILEPGVRGAAHVL